MIVDIIKHGERVGVTGNFLLDGVHLCSAGDLVRELEIYSAPVPVQWVALYRPANWFVRVWRWLRGGDPVQQIGFARVAHTSHGRITFDRVSWSAERVYEGTLSIYVARPIATHADELAMREGWS